jgi:hypothetical protein
MSTTTDSTSNVTNKTTDNTDLEKQKNVDTTASQDSSAKKTLTNTTTSVQDSSAKKDISDTSNSVQDTISKILTTNNILIFIGFLAVYFGFSYYKSGGQTVATADTSGKGVSMIIDIIFFMILGLVVYNIVSAETDDKDSNITGKFINTLTDYVNQPASVITSIFILIGLYLVVYMFGIPMNKESKPISVSIVEAIAWSLFIIVLIVDVFKYLFGVSFDEIFDKIKAYFRGETKKEEKDKKEEEDKKCDTKDTEVVDPEAEVFNVSNNLYTYDDAKAICKSYDAKLATYEQVEAAYNNGAEWCNYGWSDGQMALFPTQKETWEKLQKLDEGVCDKSKKKGNNCGRPGVNGGYIGNPYVKFGVNCFGKKPSASEKDLKLMETKKTQVYPKTPQEKALEKKVDYWKNNRDKYLQLNAYNTKKWTEKNQKMPDSSNAVSKKETK